MPGQVHAPGPPGIGYRRTILRQHSFQTDKNPK